jgi:cytochrome c oxidase subunit 6a
MKRDAIEQIKARIARQKEIVEGTHRPHAEEVEEMYKWIKISIMVATPICVLSFLKDQLLAHPHRLEAPEPDYMKIRTKAFPWECDDCELFNTECWNKCRAEKAGIAYEGGHH